MEPLTEQPEKFSSEHHLSAWHEFEGQLTEVLSKLEEHQHLIIVKKGTNQYVQFAAQGASGLRAEATSNQFLKAAEQLDASQIASILEAGWNSFTGSAEHASPEQDPDGSPNYFIDYPAPVIYEKAAGQAVQVLTAIFGTALPDMLEYIAFDSERNALEFKQLGIRKNTGSNTIDLKENLSERLLEIVRKTTGIDDLEYDEDQDICLRYGDIPVYISLRGNDPYVRFHSVLDRETDNKERLLGWINEINPVLAHLHLFEHSGIVHAVTYVPAFPLIAAQVRHVLSGFGHTVESLYGLLREEVSGDKLRLIPGQSQLRH